MTIDILKLLQLTGFLFASCLLTQKPAARTIYFGLLISA